MHYYGSLTPVSAVIFLPTVCPQNSGIGDLGFTQRKHCQSFNKLMGINLSESPGMLLRGRSMVNRELSRTHLHSVHTSRVPCTAQQERAKGEVMILRHFCSYGRIPQQILLSCYLRIYRLFFL